MAQFPQSTPLKMDRPECDTHVVAEPNGQVLYRASIDKEEVIVRPADLDKVEFARTHWPFLRDRRIDAYGGIVQRFGV